MLDFLQRREGKHFAHYEPTTKNTARTHTHTHNSDADCGCVFLFSSLFFFGQATGRAGLPAFLDGMARIGFTHTVAEAGRADPRWLMNADARVFDLFFGAELYPDAGGEAATTGGRFLLYRFSRTHAAAATAMKRAQELAAKKVDGGGKA